MITEWPKGTEHVTRNNNWDDDKQIRLFSDRLKGKAPEWHDDYVEEQDDELNYRDWKAAIIAKFQDAYNLAALKTKLSILIQKQEENWRVFLSRHNNPYDSTKGKEEKYGISSQKRACQGQGNISCHCRHYTSRKMQDNKIEFLEQKLSDMERSK